MTGGVLQTKQNIKITKMKVKYFFYYFKPKPSFLLRAKVGTTHTQVTLAFLYKLASSKASGSCCGTPLATGKLRARWSAFTVKAVWASDEPGSEGQLEK